MNLPPILAVQHRPKPKTMIYKKEEEEEEEEEEESGRRRRNTVGGLARYTLPNAKRTTCRNRRLTTIRANGSVKSCGSANTLRGGKRRKEEEEEGGGGGG